ncbi:RNase H domain-containing protein [Aphis craccivora]|uniref:RNase H domain-containing protein n=1 Tax=Aphis craccivora TaxID=307492 RepID=A0A6G0Y2M1_APHCR|nr:RNase H domain-containing protein [Aphis craccivora]
MTFIIWLHRQPVLFGSSEVSLYRYIVNLHHSSIQKLWMLEWNSLPESYAFDYRSLFKNIYSQPWFQSLKINRAYKSLILKLHADSLADSTANQSYSVPLRCPYTDIVTLHHSLFKNIYSQPWFQSLKINRAVITKFTRFRTGHSLLPHHSFKLGLNNSTYCPLPNCFGEYADFQHLLINCPSLSIQRSQLKILFSTSGINFSVIDALSTDRFNIIKDTLYFILQSVLQI